MAVSPANLPMPVKVGGRFIEPHNRVATAGLNARRPFLCMRRCAAESARALRGERLEVVLCMSITPTTSTTWKVSRHATIAG